MSKLINIGFGNVINTAKILTIVNPDAAPIKRMVQHARDEQRIVDATQGRKTKSVILIEGNITVLSALMPETLMRRFNGADEGDSDE